MKVWRKQTIRWTIDDKRVAPHTPDAQRSVEHSKRFYGTIRDADGNAKQVPLCEDRQASLTLLKRLQTEAERNRALGVTKTAQERLRPLGDILDEYAAFLRTKANTERYVKMTLNRLRSLLSATQTTTLAELDTERTAKALHAMREAGTSVATSNHYARAVKGLSRWAWIERKATDDPLRSLRLLNGNLDRKRVRRSLTSGELKRLIKTTRESGVSLYTLTPDDRAMLYTLAAYTGLRASELASLTPASFDLPAKTVTVQAAYSKRRRQDTLPLHASLITQVKRWLGNKRPDAPLFAGSWANFNSANVARLLRSDLKRASIAYVQDGRYADFHALRHTFISALARSGVNPSQAKELARHSTITLTMDVYSHCETEELRSALNMLPPL